MTNNYSPYGSTPGAEYYYDKHASPSPTPSPRGQRYYYPQTPQQQQQRPATRAHFRQGSTGFESFSPRYTSSGQYATANVSSSRSSRKHDQWASSHAERRRRNSYSYYRASDSHGDSDEDEYIEIGGVTYVLPARSKPKRYSSRDYYFSERVGGHGTDHHYYAQTPFTPYTDRSESFATPRPEPERRPGGHSRRASTSMPQRPSTATGRPSSSHRKQQPPPAPKATEADAKKHRIPKGFSLKNWDPTEQPIMLLGSVFDANSLGKWIYDWTVYHHGAATPISDMAGEMWLLLIQLFGKVKRADECAPRIRSAENKEMIDDFIESGERLAEKLRKLLKSCEAPMLRASKRKETQLGRNSGIEFVETLFGRERELTRTEQFMQSVRLWNLRFDANCEDIIRKPHM